MCKSIVKSLFICNETIVFFFENLRLGIHWFTLRGTLRFRKQWLSKVLKQMINCHWKFEVSLGVKSFWRDDTFVSGRLYTGSHRTRVRWCVVQFSESRPYYVTVMMSYILIAVNLLMHNSTDLGWEVNKYPCLQAAVQTVSHQGAKEGLQIISLLS